MLAAIHADERAAGDFTPFRDSPQVAGHGPRRLRGGARRHCRERAGRQRRHVSGAAAPWCPGGWRAGASSTTRASSTSPREFRAGRFTIVSGLPLATDDHQVIAEAVQAYAHLGVTLSDACPDEPSVVTRSVAGLTTSSGMHRTRTNWTASNTSFVERDSADRLRGFDDHAAKVKTVDRAGRTLYTVARDYSDLDPAAAPSIRARTIRRSSASRRGRAMCASRSTPTFSFVSRRS